jgi:diphosphomevalonate decarboxylase
MTTISTAWRSPSNIALVKYWGKYGQQMPRNASLSFTLTNAYTETSLHGTAKTNVDSVISVNFLFEGKSEPKFAEKIVRYFDGLRNYFPFIAEYHWEISSQNSFPHSTGIASSASSMSALALCLCSVEQQLQGIALHDDAFFRKASIVSRLGSGSACRSVYPELALWGRHDDIPGSSDEYALPMQQQLHPVFRQMQDAILIVSKKVKDVSSRAGHALMEGNPYAHARYEQANTHITDILHALVNGDITAFGRIVEKEALTLHALMMTSEPSYLLMRPNTLAIIEKIRSLRETKGVPVCFTLDAGPNVHLLYPKEVSATVETFIQEELLAHCEERQWIKDYTGTGPAVI